MDCRSFRKNHVAFVDDTLPGIALTEMQGHLFECQGCSLLDQRVRRSLVVARNNVPRIEPSPDFSGNLAKRLDDERRKLNTAPFVRLPSSTGAFALGSTFAVLVVLGLRAGLNVASETFVTHPPVDVAPTLLDEGVSRGATPAFVASFSTGMAILPALLLVDEVPVRFANELVPGRPGRSLSDAR